MKLLGSVSIIEDGVQRSIHGMITQLNLLEINSENVIKFAIPGYQKTQGYISSFAELIGCHAVSSIKDTKVGRIRHTGNPLDIAINTKSYLQATLDGENVTNLKDGQLKIDKDGNLLTLNNEKVLSDYGTPIVFKNIPGNLDDIHIDEKGKISYLDRQTNLMVKVGRLSVVNEQGLTVDEPDVKQRYIEDSNVNLTKEFLEITPLRRGFEANKQMFVIQNDTISKSIQTLGSVQ